MAERFPSLDADDLIQETFIAVAKVLPDYRYAPDEKGHFRSFLTGILHHKALNTLRTERRRQGRMQVYAATQPSGFSSEEGDEQVWREALYEIALQQVLANPDIANRSKQIFIRTAMKGERPEIVAESLSVSRDVVDQTKKRMIDRLRKIIDTLKGADEV